MFDHRAGGENAKPHVQEFEGVAGKRSRGCREMGNRRPVTAIKQEATELYPDILDVPVTPRL